MRDWDNYTRSSNVNRRVRYIYMGNLLPAFEKAQSGKLISYTCKEYGNELRTTVCDGATVDRGFVVPRDEEKHFARAVGVYDDV